MTNKKIVFSSKQLIDQNISPEQLQKILLKNRSITPSHFDEFLKPSHPRRFSSSDFGLSSVKLNKAVNRIKKAIKSKQSILIYGDYDVDGITATAILWQTLRSVGANVTPFIPHRDKDGYGIKFSSVLDFQKQKNTHFDLIITVDNGIVANKEIKKLSQQGIDVIIIDHHLATDTLPPALTCLHSTKTSASVLSWFLSKQFIARPATPALPDLGLAALGLVADCQPLLSINRHVAFHGLLSLRHHSCPGIKALLSSSRIDSADLSVYHLGFILGPQINAIGRLDDPTDALRLLCASQISTALPFARKLHSANLDRQLLQKQAINLALQAPPAPTDKLIFQSNPGFHPGIIGLIAGYLSQNFYLPAIIISQQKNISKASCRSVAELDITKILRRFSSLLIDLGGHAAAAGFSIKTQNIPKLRKKLMAFIQKKLAKIDLQPHLKVDALARLSALKIQNITAISCLQPFGIGNPRPLFYFQGLKVVSKRLVGADSSHLKLQLDDPATPKIENTPADAIAFKWGHLDQKIQTGQLIDIVASLDLNTWGGHSTPQLIVKEIFLPN